MKLSKTFKIIALLAIFACLPLRSLAQRKNEAFFNTGYNFKGYFFGLGYSLNLSYPYGEQWRLIGEGQASFEEFRPRGEKVPVASYMAMLSINYGIDELFREADFSNWKSYIGLGGLLGNERTNRGKKFLSDGAEIIGQSKFIYGVFANFSVLIPFFSDRVDLYWQLNYKPFYLINSDHGYFIHNLGIGIVFRIR